MTKDLEQDGGEKKDGESKPKKAKKASKAAAKAKK